MKNRSSYLKFEFKIKRTVANKGVFIHTLKMMHFLLFQKLASVLSKKAFPRAISVPGKCGYILIKNLYKIEDSFLIVRIR